MNNKIDFTFLLNDSRARVYLLWAVLTGIGFTATHYYQDKNINAVWAVISIIGLGYMYKVMPLRVTQMKRIFTAWLVPIVFGMVMSALAFKVEAFFGLVQYLGAFWLFVMAIGYFWNGLVDPPSHWYYFAAGLNLAAAVLCFVSAPFTEQQYLIAAIVSVWSMLNLWLLRSEA